MELFMNTSLNHMSIQSRLVSQPSNKLIPNNEHFFQGFITYNFWYYFKSKFTQQNDNKFSN